MSHPLVNNLQSLSDKELYEQLQDLTKKYWMTNNPAVQAQIALIVDDIKWEADRRKRDNTNNNDVDNLIKVV
jgi:hypothetical protein